MRGGIDARFPVAEAPVDRRARHRRLLFDELADAREVAVRRANGVLDEAGILLRKRVGARDRVRHGGGAWPHALVASALMPSAESPEVIEKNERRDSDMNLTSDARYRKARGCAGQRRLPSGSKSLSLSVSWPDG